MAVRCVQLRGHGPRRHTATTPSREGTRADGVRGVVNARLVGNRIKEESAARALGHAGDHALAGAAST